MIGLLKKDFIYIKNNYVSILIFIAVALLNGFTNSIIFMFMFSSFLFASLAVTSIYNDQENKSLTFILTLPVSKNSYVNSKYLLCFLLILVSGLLCLVATPILESIRGEGSTSATALMLITSFSILPTTIYTSLLIPLYLKFGSEKARVFSFIVIFGTMGFMFAVINLSTLTSIDTSFIESLTPTSLSIGSLLISLIIFFISSIISKKIIVV